MSDVVNPPPMATWLSTSPEQTEACGAALARHARGGELLALCGPLGAGKTRLVRGLARGLDVPPDEPVVSPTFVLMREYDGRLHLYHLDAYRLAGADELAALGLDELVADAAAMVVIEWAERVAEALPPAATWLELEHAGAVERRISGRGPLVERAAAELDMVLCRAAGGDDSPATPAGR